MSNQQIVNPPNTAYLLTIIGAIIGLLGSILITIFLSLTIILAPIGIWLIIANALMIHYAKRLMAQPHEHNKYGVYILILSILAGGNLFCLIGGILAITYQPMPSTTAQSYQPYQPYAQQSQQYAPAKYCPQCGNAVVADALYCPKCGAKIPQ
jgi:hypothetical protein